MGSTLSCPDHPTNASRIWYISGSSFFRMIETISNLSSLFGCLRYRYSCAAFIILACLDFLTAASGHPKASVLLAFTSTNTIVSFSSMMRSISHLPCRQLRSNNTKPLRIKYASAISSPFAPVFLLDVCNLNFD